ncbi:MAG: SGNH/GDSL hydrolase family protein [Clostridia bacterium]|nr:SGNH/GDSL hydrolase family protein [Clostridia bacterium]
MRPEKMYEFDPNEKPLDRLAPGGGFCGVFRSIGCVGDSLASGEFESRLENGEGRNVDMFDYSWGQYIARDTGAVVRNFSRGGMTAKEYWTSFAEDMGYWDPALACQAYIIALGVNDLYYCKWETGSIDDIHPDEPEKNAENFAGYYGKIISRLRSIQPRARFFLMSMPKEPDGENEMRRKARDLLDGMTKIFPRTYLLDFYEYFPEQTDEFKRFFYTGTHLDPMGYLFTARCVESYIDWHIRRDPRAFAEVPFIGTDLRYYEEI